MSKNSVVQNRRQLTYAGAAIALEGTVAKSRQISAPECIAIVDAGGNLLGYARVEGAAILALEPAIAKAATSASLGIPQVEFLSSSESISRQPTKVVSQTLVAAFLDSTMVN